MNNLAFALPATFRSVAALVIFGLVLWAAGIPTWFNTAHAANVSSFSDVISDSDLNADAAHRIQFTSPNGISTDNSVDVILTFDPSGSGFDFTGFTAGDVDIVAGASQVADAGSCGAPGNDMYVTLGGSDDVILNLCDGHAIASSTTFVLDVGTTTGGNLINNPGTANSYVIQLTGTNNFADSGDTRIAVIDDVTVTASVDTIFTFSINPVLGNTTVNDDVTVTSGTTTATSVPFGTIAPGTPKLMAQELRVDTNAYNGFAVTVEADVTLTAGNGATIDEFVDAGANASSTQWTSPAGTMGNDDTYGHWGLTSDDDVVSSSTANMWGSGEALYVGNFVANPIEVFYHNTPVENSAGMGVGSTTVAYKVEIMALQEAAQDYQATLTYVATPVF